MRAARGFQPTAPAKSPLRGLLDAPPTHASASKSPRKRPVVAVIAKLPELALEGDVQATKAYLDRLVGPIRSSDDERRLEERVDETLGG